MAFRTKKISQMDPKGSNLASTDLLEISELVSGSYVTKSITGAEIIGGASAGFVPYIGAIQDLDLGANELFTGKLWLYDAVNDNYGSTHYSDGNYHIEDADGHKLLVIEDGFMQIHKTDTIQSNLYTSGLTVTRDHYLPDASGTIALTSDLSAYVPTTRTLTINGTTQDLSADRTFTISTGITIGTTAITSGTVGRVLFEGTGNVVQESANLFWNNTNGRLGIGTSTPNKLLEVAGNNPEISTQIICGGGKFSFLVGITEIGSLSISGTGEMKLFANTTYFPTFYSNGLERMRIATTTGNVLINTTTDAGFKLDVNGTARVSGNFTAITGTWDSSGIAVNNIRRNTGAMVITTDGNTLNSLTFDATSAWGSISSGVVSGMRNIQNFAGTGTSSFVNFAFGGVISTGSSGRISLIEMTNPITTTNASSVVRGVFYNPTLNLIAGTTHYAFHSTSGRIRYQGLPTSPTGLSAGDVWNNLGILNIV